MNNLSQSNVPIQKKSALRGTFFVQRLAKFKNFSYLCSEKLWDSTEKCYEVWSLSEIITFSSSSKLNKYKSNTIQIE